MENTFISHELEEMRSQISILKQQLEKQNIINDTHIRNSMKSKANDLHKTIRGTVGGGIFAILYCPICFHFLGCSLPFVADLPINFNIKMNLVEELSKCLKKMGKKIKVSYF